MGFILLFYLLPFATRAFSPSHFPRSVIGTKFRPVQCIKEVDEYALDELRQQQRSDEAWRERQKQRQQDMEKKKKEVKVSEKIFSYIVGFSPHPVYYRILLMLVGLIDYIKCSM